MALLAVLAIPAICTIVPGANMITFYLGVSSLVTVLLERLVFSSATQQTSSLPNMSRQSSTTTPSLLCEFTCTPIRSTPAPPPHTAPPPAMDVVCCKLIISSWRQRHIVPGDDTKHLRIARLGTAFGHRRVADWPVGSVTSHTLLDCSIPPVKRITTDCDLFHIPRLMSSSFAFPSPRLLHSKTCARSGSPRSATTAPAFPA